MDELQDADRVPGELAKRLMGFGERFRYTKAEVKRREHLRRLTVSPIDVQMKQTNSTRITRMLRIPTDSEQPLK